ncbi:MAG: hypothetical protein GY792_16460, partial [Gammaproteobacteria bacterium]|nr:hypothetical protein [Gammaproteobacteria bacterium]
LNVTTDHPIYIEGQGWLNAENLSIGDRLRRADGGMARVLAIERVTLDEPQLVYNFTVKGPRAAHVLRSRSIVLRARINEQRKAGKNEQGKVEKRGPGKGLWKREGRGRSGEGRLEVIESALEVRFIEHLFLLHHTQ